MMALLGVSLFAWGCSGGSSSSPNATPVAPTAGSIVVRGFEWRFEPSSIVLPQGQEVRIDFLNEGSTLHDLKIDDLEAADVTSQGSGLSGDEGELFVAAEDGEAGTLIFTPIEAGEFEFYCTIPRHRSLGMKGTITVEGPGEQTP